MTTNRSAGTRGVPPHPRAERHEGSRHGRADFLGSGRSDLDTGDVLSAGGNALGPDADTRPIEVRYTPLLIEVAANHPLSPVTITTSVRDFRGVRAAAGRRRPTGRNSADAAARGRLVRTTGGPPPRAVVDRTHAWLAVALVAAVVVLVAVASDAATVPPLGLAERPVVTTVVTLPVPPDPRATEGPAPQDRQRVLSW